MSYIPNRNTSSALFYSVILYVVCAASFVVSSLYKIGYPVIWQLIGVMSLTAGAYITVRYVLTAYKYVLRTDEDGDVSLEVVKIVRTAPKTICNVSTLTAEALTKKLPLAEIEKRYGAINRRYNFCANILPTSPATVYCYIFEFNGMRCLIDLELDENSAFFAYFNELITGVTEMPGRGRF